VEENLAKQAQVMGVIEREQAAYKQAFGFAEWRSACEVRHELLQLAIIKGRAFFTTTLFQSPVLQRM
jgi:hypothetical protein